jgi:hypothetical protein
MPGLNDIEALKQIITIAANIQIIPIFANAEEKKKLK